MSSIRLPEWLGTGPVAVVAGLSLVALGIVVTSDESPKKKKRRKKKKKGEIEVHGLINIGNTCFMNSLLQAMSNMDEFQAYVRQVLKVCPESGLIRSLLDIINVSHSKKGDVKDTNEFHSFLAAEAGALGNFQQHDAHELFVSLLAIIENKVIHVADINTKRELFDLRHNPFSGTCASVLSCSTCGYESPIRHSTFNSLSLSIPPQFFALGAQGSGLTLESLLRLYTINEQLDGARCQYCTANTKLSALNMCIEALEKKGKEEQQEYTGMDRLYSERLRLETMVSTNCLVTEAVEDVTKDKTSEKEDVDVEGKKQDKKDGGEEGKYKSYISRCSSNRSPTQQVRLIHNSVRSILEKVNKISAARKMKKQILLAKLPCVLHLHIGRLLGDMKLTTKVKYPTILDMSPFCTTSSTYNRLDHLPPAQPSIKHIYFLSAIVVHHGSAFSGHYTCYRRVSKHTSSGTSRENLVRRMLRGTPSKWVHISDDSVVEVTEEQALAAEAYILFYENSGLTSLSTPSQ